MENQQKQVTIEDIPVVDLNKYLGAENQDSEEV